MDHLTADQKATLRAKLERERTELAARLDGELAELDEVSEETELQDGGSVEETRQRVYRLSERDRARLEAVRAALVRFDDGTYGICEETDEPIPFARLELEPTTRYTVEAQEELERERAMRPGGDDNPGAY